MVVLPTARSPMMSSRWPRPSANRVSTDHEAGLNGLGHQIAIDDVGCRPLDRFQPIRDDGSLAVERTAERIDDTTEQCRSHRHAHDIARAAHGIAGLDRVYIVKQYAADPVALEHLGEAELSLVETQQLVEPDGGQSGNERDAVPDLLHPADLLRFAVRATWRQALREPARARRPRGCQDRLSCARSARILREVGAPTVGNDKVRAAQFKAGDKRGVDLEGDLRMNSERLANQFSIALLVGRLDRGRTDRFEHDAVGRDDRRAVLRKPPNLLKQPVEEGGAYRRAVKAGDEAPRDFDREPAGPLDPGRFGGVSLFLDRHPRRGLQRRRLLGGCGKRAVRASSAAS